MYAEIIAVGDEIVSGQTLDTNSQWLSGRLEELGVRVRYHSTVGDEREPCVRVFRQAIERAEIVIATGGLGPTADDLTRQALGEAAGRELVQYPEALEHIRSLFTRRQRPMPPQNEVQSFFPAGSRMIPNSQGTAPGIDLEVPREGRAPCRFFALPGVPAEMQGMWPTVREALRELGAGRRVIVRRKINCFGAGESQIEAMLPDMIRRGRQPAVGITASKTTISLRITAEGASQAECQAAIEPVVATIRQCLGDLVFGEGDEELQHAVVKLLREKNKTLATVEIGTGGMVVELLAAVPEAKEYYLGGVVLSDPQTLKNLLGIDPAKGDTHLGPVEDLIKAAAVTQAKFQADCVLLIGPFPEYRPEASLPVHLVLKFGDEYISNPIPFAGHPDWLKIYVAKQALNLIRLKLLENS
jgi:nicotinamide-nucleotide amidase